MIEFRIDRRSGVAAYQQIVQQTRDALLLGHLRIGDQLPTAREVVAETGINPNTVLKAYRELDRAGLVQTRAGSGTFVTATPERVVDAQDSEVGAALGEWLRGARDAGLGRPEVEAMVKAWLDTVFPDRGSRARGAESAPAGRAIDPTAVASQGNPRGEAAAERAPEPEQALESEQAPELEQVAAPQRIPALPPTKGRR